MTIHIDQKPLVITATGATAVRTPYPTDGSWNKDGIQIYNSDATNVLFVKSGDNTVVADATTCQFVPPNTTKSFRRNPNDTNLSTVLSTAGTSIAYATPQSGFPQSMS